MCGPKAEAGPVRQVFKAIAESLSKIGGGHRDLPIQPIRFSKTQAEARTSWGLLTEGTAKPRLAPRVLSTSQSSFLSLRLGFCYGGLE